MKGALPPRIADAIERLTSVQEDAASTLASANFVLQIKKDMVTKTPVDETIIANTKATVEKATKDLGTQGLVLKHECKPFK